MTVTVSDDDVTSVHTQTVVVVMSLLQMIDNALALVDQLVSDGKLKQNPFRNNLETARKQILNNKPTNAVPPLQNLRMELDSLVQSSKLAQDADPLKVLVTTIIESIT